MLGIEFLGQKFFYVVGGILIVSGGMVLYFFYWKKLLNKIINVFVFGLFCVVFVGGWDVLVINGELGYFELCWKVVEFFKEKNVFGYCVLNVCCFENMDVYLYERVKEVIEEEVLDNKYQNIILMILNKKICLNKKLEEFVNGKEYYVIGCFFVMVF